MEVELISHTPEPDIIAAVAAMLTHSKSNFKELKKEDEEKLRKVQFIEAIMGGEVS